MISFTYVSPVATARSLTSSFYLCLTQEVHGSIQLLEACCTEQEGCISKWNRPQTPWWCNLSLDAAFGEDAAPLGLQHNSLAKRPVEDKHLRRRFFTQLSFHIPFSKDLKLVNIDKIESTKVWTLNGSTKHTGYKNTMKLNKGMWM